MKYIADLHLHSPYAYATSKYLSPTTLHQWAQIKGIDVISSGDFTHPQWLATLEEALTPVGNGFYQLAQKPVATALPSIRPLEKPVYFCLGTEVNTLYTDKGKVRKSHHLIYAPDFHTVKKLNKKLASFGNLANDGRPTLHLSARNLLEIICETSPDCHLIPAHIWTPWFSIFGSKFGYDSIEEVFQDLTDHIFALETGLSSDPAMNWCLSKLDRYTMVSNSDAHSPQKLGREATRFDTTLSYRALFAALKTKDGFAGTFEYFPEQGKYHWDGHRHCQRSFHPKESLQHKKICPTCGKPLTIGVLNRVHTLADRPAPQQPQNAPNFDYVVPLTHIISQIVHRQEKTKSVTNQFIKIINRFGNEFTFLHQTPLAQIAQYLPEPYFIAIQNLRRHNVKRIAGYDGHYGKMILWEESMKADRQQRLF